MKQKTAKEWAAYFSDDEIVMPAELSDAFLGLVQSRNGCVACYDYNKAIIALEKANFSEIEAVENIENYISDVAQGSKAPLFLNKYETSSAE